MRKAPSGAGGSSSRAKTAAVGQNRPGKGSAGGPSYLPSSLLRERLTSRAVELIGFREPTTDGFWDDVAEVFGVDDAGELTPWQRQTALAALADLVRHVHRHAFK